jgi:hypothetical protein
VAEDDSAAGEVVGRDLDGHPVALKNANAEPAHIAAERCQDGMAVGQLDAEGRIRKDFGDLPFELNRFFFRHVGVGGAGKLGRGMGVRECGSAAYGS